MAFVSLHVKLQLPSYTIVNVTADSLIIRVGLMLPSYEAFCSAREAFLRSCSLSPQVEVSREEDTMRAGDRRRNQSSMIMVMTGI